MRIVIATALYPPDLAEPAPYAKELARRLRAEKHQVTVVLFGHLPETVPGVAFKAIDKRDVLPKRLWQFAKALWSASAETDVLYVLNGAPVELIATPISFLRRLPMVLHLGDRDANLWVGKHAVLRLIKKFAKKQAQKHVHELPPPRPEVLPFDPHPFSDFATYEQDWKKHIATLTTLFTAVIQQHNQNNWYE